MPNTGIKERITTQWRYFTSDRKSIYTLIIALLIPVTYELMRFVPLEDTLTPHTFSMAPTLFLQKILGTDGIVAIAASYYYVIPHVLLLVGLLVMIFFSKNRPPWYYFTIAIMIYVIDFAISTLFPVAPPVRLAIHDYVPIRIEHFPLSETTITAHYSALPSGHIFTSVFGALIAKLEGWKRTYYIYLANTVIMTVVIVYTGDHYLIDSFASIALVAAIYVVMEKIVRKRK